MHHTKSLLLFNEVLALTSLTLEEFETLMRAPCALVSCDGNTPMVQPVRKATAGWSGRCHWAKPAVNWDNRPSVSWSMPSPACSTDITLISLGSNRLPSLHIL